MRATASPKKTAKPPSVPAAPVSGAGAAAHPLLSPLGPGPWLPFAAAEPAPKVPLPPPLLLMPVATPCPVDVPVPWPAPLAAPCPVDVPLAPCPDDAPLLVPPPTPCPDDDAEPPDPD